MSFKSELDKKRNFWVVAKYWKPEIRKSLKLIKYDWTILLSVWLLGAGAGWLGSVGAKLLLMKQLCFCEPNLLAIIW